MMKIVTGKGLAWLMLLLPTFALLSGCQSTGSLSTSRASVKQSTTFSSVNCDSNIQIVAADLPAQLYLRMNNCIKAEEWEDATFLYALAGSKTWYDAKRVDSQYARAMHGRLLKESIGSLNNQQKTTFWDKVQQNMNDRQQRETLCRRVKEAGAPGYQPDYMFIDPSRTVGFTFSNKISWERAVNSYLECQ